MIATGWLIVAVLVAYGVGFICCAAFSLQKIERLESALAWLQREPDNELAQANATDVLRGG